MGTDVRMDHADVATALNNLAEIYREENDFAQAETFYLRSLAIGERVLGRGHPELAIGYNNLAGLYRKQGRLSQAEAWFHRALSMLDVPKDRRRSIRRLF